MTVLEQSIKSLQQNIQLLIKKNRLLEKEKLQLEQELLELREQHGYTRQELEITAMQNAILKASQQQLSETERKEMEKKLQGFIQEIDKCVALLTR